MENKQLIVKKLEDLINSSLKFNGDMFRTYDLRYFKGFDDFSERVYITRCDFCIVPNACTCKLDTTYLGYLDISEYSGLDLITNVSNLIYFSLNILEKE